MGVESSIGSKVLLRHVISILTIISLEGWVPLGSLTNGSCESDECGKVMIGYPFGNDSQPCCPQHQLLKLNSLWKDPIFYDDQSLGLISESGRTGNACVAPPEKSPQPPSASDADVPGSEVLSFLKSNHGRFHLAFLRNCNGSPNGDYSHPDLTCLSAGANHSYVALGGRPDDLHLSRLACESHVIVPVELAGEDWEKVENDESAKEELKHGFRLQWNLTFWESCVKCKISGGKCGELDGSFLCKCSDKANLNTCKRAQHGDLVMKVAIAASGVGIAIVILVVYSLREKPLIRKHMAMMMGKREHSVAAQQIEGLISSRRYTYKDIKRITNFFQEKLGQGGYVYVYKGKLRDGQLVAVKLLKNLKGDGEEFINEVASINRTSHVNIVSLLGFCYEGSKRALVYEFMPNGSLEKFIFKSDTLEANQQLSWETLYRISLGIAQGLAYLHRGCNSRILHFDIKPHNILLDQHYCPKISDFGLAKICPREESIVSMLGARGTAGYIAPELVIRNIGGVSHKLDVYSLRHDGSGNGWREKKL